MTPQTLTAIRAILATDQSLSDKERSLALKACENPGCISFSLGRGQLTPKQAADILMCHRKTLFRYAKKGALHPVYLNARTVRFDRSEVEQFAANGSATSSCSLPQSVRVVREA